MAVVLVVVVWRPVLLVVVLANGGDGQPDVASGIGTGRYVVASRIVLELQRPGVRFAWLLAVVVVVSVGWWRRGRGGT